MMKSFRLALLAGAAALAVSACATNRTNVAQPDFSSQSAAQQSSALGQLAARYKANPRDKATIIYYSAALRAAPPTARPYGHSAMLGALWPPPHRAGRPTSRLWS